MKRSAILFPLLLLVSLSITACNPRVDEPHHELQKITVTNPLTENVLITQQFVCQIHSQRHIELRALERGYLQAVDVKEGQLVKQGEVIFKVIPVIYKAKLDAEQSACREAQLQYDYGKKLADDKVISENEVAILKAKLLRAEANMQRAEAEFNFASVKAPFEGILHRLNHQQGSLVEKGDVLTSLSDNSLMWVYFNVPEARYVGDMADLSAHVDELKIELLLADGEKFNQLGKLGAIEAEFDNTTGNIQFRADFPNPDRLLRNGQTGTILINRSVKDAVVIPQRATFSFVDKLCVYVVGKDDVAQQREITVKTELEDLYVVEKGISVDDKIIFEGLRQVRDGKKVEYQECSTDEVYGRLKFHAE